MMIANCVNSGCRRRVDAVRHCTTPAKQHLAETNRDMTTRISVITLGVKDMSAAERFYSKGLGLETGSVKGGVTYFDTGGTWLAIFPRDALAQYAGVSSRGEGFPGITLSINVDSREDVNDLLNRARSAGADIVKVAGDVSWGGYTGWFRDPFDHLWEVVWNPRPFLGRDA